MATAIPLGVLAEQLGATVEGDAAQSVCGVGTLESAGPGQLVDHQQQEFRR